MSVDINPVDKSEWGDGPWQSEPDRLEWKDAASGLTCLIVRGYAHGGLCGYVGVPVTHPAFKKGYYDVEVVVHGGLTYSDKCHGNICHKPQDGEDDEVWWLGFDCAHLDDVSPRRHAVFNRLGCPWDEEATYKDIDFVKAEVTQLAAQLAAMKGSPSEV